MGTVHKTAVRIFDNSFLHFLQNTQIVDKVGFCHCEPVTDVTGVAIRFSKKHCNFKIF